MSTYSGAMTLCWGVAVPVFLSTSSGQFICSRRHGKSILPAPSTSCRLSSAFIRGIPRKAARPRLSTGELSMSMSGLAAVETSVVWFRVGDLRSCDHGGLTEAVSSTIGAVYPVFIITPDTPSGAFSVLASMRESLRGRLFVRYAANDRDGLTSFLEECGGVGRVHVFRNLDSRALEDVAQLSSLHRETHFAFWRETYRRVNTDSFESVPMLYPDFLKLKPIAPGQSQEEDVASRVSKSSDGPDSGDLDGLVRQHKELKSECSVSSVENAYIADSVRVGAPNVCGFEGDTVDPTAFVKQLLHKLELDDTIDVARTLQPLFWFGMISSEGIRRAVGEFEREQGRLWRPIYRLGAKTILRYLDGREFAWCCAERDLISPHLTMGGFRPKFYNWRGFLTRYVEAGRQSAKPAVLLVHGFGASAQHWERNIALLSDEYHCFAFCNLGFGRSEKPPAVYTQYIWEMFQASFAKEVVRQPAFIAGNSIGGYLSAAFSRDLAPEYCKGVALINSAGSLYSPEEFAALEPVVKKPQSFLAATLQSNRSIRLAACNLLLAYLQRGIKSTLTRVYPTSPAGWTDDLELEIRRNSLDNGAVDVIASGFVLPAQRSLNELLSDKTGVPVLVFQGSLDPLGSAGRAEKFRKVIPPNRSTIVEIEAGHCPMDEKPEVFCEVFRNWMSAGLDLTGALPVDGQAQVRAGSTS